MIEAGAVDIAQPDVFIAGGVSQLMKIGVLASVGNAQEGCGCRPHVGS